MTIDDLKDLCVKLSAEGKGGCTVLLASDAEGNAFHPLSSIHFEGWWKPRLREVVELSTGAKPNCVAFYPN